MIQNTVRHPQNRQQLPLLETILATSVPTQTLLPWSTVALRHTPKELQLAMQSDWYYTNDYDGTTNISDIGIAIDSLIAIRKQVIYCTYVAYRRVQCISQQRSAGKYVLLTYIAISSTCYFYIVDVRTIEWRSFKPYKIAALKLCIDFYCSVSTSTKSKARTIELGWPRVLSDFSSCLITTLTLTKYISLMYGWEQQHLRS